MNRSIILGVTGSTAAYKRADIAGGLVRTGRNFNTIIMSNAARFIMPLTLKNLIKSKVYISMFLNAQAKLERRDFVLLSKRKAVNSNG